MRGIKARRVKSLLEAQLRSQTLEMFCRSTQCERPPVVYHYTSLPSFLAIITSKSIWCSSVAFANDPSEVSYGDELIRSTVRSQIPTRMVELLDQIDVDYYAASFSEANDDLAQWRTYCDDGRGVSIGFRPDHLTASSADAFLDEFVVCRAIYDPDQQRQLIQEVTKLYANALSAGAVGMTVETVLLDLSLYLALLRGVFKAPAYAAEREWRVVSATQIRSPRHQTRVQFRATPAAIIPYMSLEFSKDEPVPIESVTIGPCLDGRQTEQSIRAFLLQTGHHDTKLSHSIVRMRQRRRAA